VVVEIEFGEWTSDGRLRHPVYLGERIDVDPAAVVREP
jgi:bifunctional non-homologous end joining protein LigD